MNQVTIINVDQSGTIVLQDDHAKHPLPHRVTAKIGYGCVTRDANGEFVSYMPATNLRTGHVTTYEEFLAQED